MSSTATLDFPAPVMAALLDLVGRPTGLSPRGLLGSGAALAHDQLVHLVQQGVLQRAQWDKEQLSPFIHSVLATLLQPRTLVTLRAWAGNSDCVEMDAYFPGAIGQGGGVALNRINGHFRMHAPVDEGDLIGLLGPLVPAHSQFEPFEARLDAAQAAVLLGLIDVLNGAPLSADRRHPPTLPLLFGYILDDWALTGFEQWLTFVPLLARRSEPPPYPELLDAYGTLQQAGFVALSADEVVLPGYHLRRMDAILDKVCGGIQWQRQSVLDDASCLTSERICAFGTRGAILALAPFPGGLIDLRSVRRADLTRYLAAEITAREGEIPVAPLSAEQLQPEDRPRSEDGLPVLLPPPKPAPGTISATVAPLPPSVPVTRSPEQVSGSPLSTVSRCPNPRCNQPIRPGLAFCTACGVRLA